MPFTTQNFIVFDVALFFENLGQTLVYLSQDYVNFLKFNHIRIANPGQHISDQIGCRHSTHLLKMFIAQFNYQLDLITPGISPCDARVRKQIRHMSNLR